MTARFELKTDGADVQAIVGSAFANKRYCRFLLLRVDDSNLARELIHRLLDSGLIKSLVDIPIDDDEDADAFRFAWIGKLMKLKLVQRLMQSLGINKRTKAIPSKFDEAVTIAFSYAGLRKWGLAEHADFPFPTPFRTGMADQKREALLGDSGRAAWQWGDVEQDPFPGVDLLVAHYRENPFNDPQSLLNPAALSEYGLQVVRIVTTCPYYIRARREPFGFKDGIAQPAINGLRAQEGPKDDDNVLAPGEFVLGHANSYGERSYCPDVVGWHSFAERGGARFARNGSYLAVRQIKQHVAKFKEFTVPEREKMIGRREDGTPLVSDPGNSAEPAEGRNDFRYRLADYNGFQCPRGSHIRRANPRDALGWDVPSGVAASKLHRLLRRGRVYTDSSTCGAGGKESTCESDDAIAGCGNGLFFIALNADLDRQFEFVQQRWFANSKFADLWDEADPALGGGAGRSFSIPGSVPIGTRLRDLPQFTTVIGGGYFFLPGISALRFIAEPQVHGDFAPPSRQADYIFT